MKELHNWKYIVEFCGGYDRWRLSGINQDGKDIVTSTPVAFDSMEKIVTTKSGSQYKLINCAANEEEQIRYILEDVERGHSLHM